MSSSATGVGMPICFLWAILLILTQKSSQKFSDVLGIMVLGFILAKTLCPQRHSKVCFELLETFWVTLKRTCLSVICSSVVGQLRWKEHIKKYKKFLIFLTNKLDFISLRKIRNNDRTIEYIIQTADIHFG